MKINILKGFKNQNKKSDKIKANIKKTKNNYKMSYLFFRIH
jgi:hypothetical protein